jgi:hypothetical protein
MVDLEKSGNGNCFIDMAYMVVWSIRTHVHYLHWMVLLDLCMVCGDR